MTLSHKKRQIEVTPDNFPHFANMLRICDSSLRLYNDIHESVIPMFLLELDLGEEEFKALVKMRENEQKTFRKFLEQHAKQLKKIQQELK